MSEVEAAAATSTAKKRRTPWPILASCLLGLLLTEFVARTQLTYEDGIATLFGQRLAPLPSLTVSQRELIRNGIDKATYYRPDSALGWTLREGGTEPPREGREAIYFANALGLRTGSERPVPDPARADRTRILLVGDSFVHGDEVPFQDTIGARLEGALQGPYEVWNGGVSGYGTDQALLRFESLVDKVGPKWAILGIFPENLLRNLTLFRPIKHRFTGFPFGKPRFVMDGAALQLVHQPVTPPDQVERTLQGFGDSGLSRSDALYLPGLYAPHATDFSVLLRWVRSRQLHQEDYERRQKQLLADGEGIQLAARLAARFAFTAERAGIRPLILLLPGGRDVEGELTGTANPLTPLARELERLALDVIDARRPLITARKAGSALRELYVREGEGHLSGQAAALIAAAIAERIERR